MKTFAKAFNLTVTTVLMFSSVSASAGIFGVDDRVAITPFAPDYQLSRSTAVAVLGTIITESSPGKFQIESDSSSGFLCKDEKFYNKPSISYACSGFLVAPDLLVTAGHCMVNFGEVRNERGMYCESYSSWVFGYSADKAGNTNTTAIPADNHYKCKQIIYAVSDDVNDYALIQLDRPVKNRRPLELLTTPVSDTSRLKMIGHPLGLPAVLSRNAKIVKNDPALQSFSTTLDAFMGNSGSAVFNQNNKVVGILISGTPANNLYADKKNSCERHNRCNENGKDCVLPDEDGKDASSEVQRLEPLIKLIEEFQKSRKN